MITDNRNLLTLNINEFFNMIFSFTALKVVLLIQLLLSIFPNAEAQVVSKSWFKNVQAKKEIT
jgi:hypothetical protein